MITKRVASIMGNKLVISGVNLAPSNQKFCLRPCDSIINSPIGYYISIMIVVHTYEACRRLNHVKKSISHIIVRVDGVLVR